MAIVHDCPQRSEAWNKLRLGRPTASCFHMIVTPAGNLSDQFERYAHHLIAERLLQRDVGTYTSPAMQRGADREDDAAAWYEFSTGANVQQVGFITTDDGRIGCSPDLLVGDDGVVEFKCPDPPTMISYLVPPLLDVQKAKRRLGKVSVAADKQERQIDKRYKPQIQGQLWVSGRQWADVLAYSDEHPVIPHHIIRVERDEEYIEILDERVTHFADELDRVEKLIRSVSRCIYDGPISETPKAELREMLRQSLEVQ